MQLLAVKFDSGVGVDSLENELDMGCLTLEGDILGVGDIAL